MPLFEFVILAVCGVIISALIEQLIPKVTAPLIQIAIGLVVGVFALSPINVSLDPEYFLLLFVAPLLFSDAKHADKTALWKYRTRILSLAVGLVVAIMLCVGFALHFVSPSIPLAVALALGAALGPTDAVAVLSLKNEVHLTRKENAQLSGEALINDASGVIAFQFAVGAAVTATWAVTEGLVNFLWLSIGGIVVGIALALVFRLIERLMRNFSIESLVIYVLLDLVTPFLVYLVAEGLDVSGILAVVACGRRLGGQQERAIGPSRARFNIVSTNVWQVILYALNGIVFILLGMQLPAAAATITAGSSISNEMLALMVLMITAILVVVRFFWFLAMERQGLDEDTDEKVPLTRTRVRSAGIMTLAGPKGCVTLAIMFSLPYLTNAGDAFPQRELVICLASGVILCTLLLANFVLPLLAPSPKNNEQEEFEKSADQRVEILRRTITELNARQTAKNATATRAVIKSYKNRIDRIQHEMDDDVEARSKEIDGLALKLDILHHQQAYIEELIDSNKVDPVAGYRLASQMNQREILLTNHHSTRWFYTALKRHVRRIFVVLVRMIQDSLPGVDEARVTTLNIQASSLVEKETIRYLEDLLAQPTPTFLPENLAEEINAHMQSLTLLVNRGPSITTIVRTADSMSDIMAVGYNLELDIISEFYERGEISRGVYRKLRENVSLMRMDLNDAI